MCSPALNTVDSKTHALPAPHSWQKRLSGMSRAKAQCRQAQCPVILPRTGISTCQGQAQCKSLSQHDLFQRKLRLAGPQGWGWTSSPGPGHFLWLTLSPREVGTAIRGTPVSIHCHPARAGGWPPTASRGSSQRKPPPPLIRGREGGCWKLSHPPPISSLSGVPQGPSQDSHGSRLPPACWVLPSQGYPPT